MKKGFTLIELLVVIAIIGILASLVFVSLAGAKARANDARIIAAMGQLRSTAEVFYGNNGNYTGFCESGDVSALKADIEKHGGKDYSCNVETGTGAGNSYCIKVRMNAPNQWWCVDSGLRSKQYSSEPADTICPDNSIGCSGFTCRCE